MSFSFSLLWQLLKNKELRREDLRIGIGASFSTLAKMTKDEYVSMRILDDICNFLDCKLEDILEHKKDKK